MGLCAVLLLRTPATRLGSLLLTPLDAFLERERTDAQNEAVGIRDALVPKTVREERDQAVHERDELRDTLASLRASVPDYEALAELRASSTAARIPAGVLATPPQSPYDSLVIDQGATRGVKEGATVFAGDARPIGRVVRVEDNTSVVELFSSPGAHLWVYSLHDHVHAPAIGVGNGTIAVSLPHGSTAGEGDGIIVPSLAGAVIGTIARVTREPSEPGVIAFVPAPIALSSLRYVSVAPEPFTMPDAATIQSAIASHASTSPLATMPPGAASSSATTTTP